MSTNPPKISLIDLCLSGPVADLLKQKDGYKEIDHSLLKSLCAEIVDYQSKIDWNAYNAVMIGTSLPGSRENDVHNRQIQHDFRARFCGFCA